MIASRTVFVVGASSPVGHFLVPRLLESGRAVYAGSRNEGRHERPPGRLDRWIPVRGGRIALSGDEISRIDALVCLAPIGAVPPLIDAGAFPALARIIAFSSTSRYTKKSSRDPYEQQLAAELEAAEQAVQRLAQHRGIAWTIFRPTLIYSPGRDRNISALAAFVRRWRFFPLPGSGRGLRQPVHADDLALACMQVLDNARTYGRAYDLSGAQPLSYRAMVEAVFRSEGLKPRVVTVPLGLLRLALRVCALLPMQPRLTPEMADRINRDLSFSHDEASRDFGFAPRPFQP